MVILNGINYFSCTDYTNFCYYCYKFFAQFINTEKCLQDILCYVIFINAMKCINATLFLQKLNRWIFFISQAHCEAQATCCKQPET